MWIPRQAEVLLVSLARGFPVIGLTGPRQSGKTTLARRAFSDKPYVSLEDPDQRLFAHEDPRSFLERYPDGAILDEVQRVPALLSYLQGIVDRTGRMGHFVLTGSQQFDLLAGVTQSLAGRIAILTLLPFSLAELSAAGRAPDNVALLLWQGLYPPIHDRAVDANVWYANYVATYLERDVRQALKVQDLDSFQRFLRLCAGRTGQLLNLASLGSDAGISQPTARAWLSVLRASHVIQTLAPYHGSFNKRVIKTPKLYFHDPGLAAWLLGIQRPAQIEAHPLFGALFETWVVSELIKSRFNRGLHSNLYFWRDRSGHEIDVLIDRGTELQPLEVKAGRTVASDYFFGIDYWRSLVGAAPPPAAWLVYGGAERQQRRGVQILPWYATAEIEP